MSTNKQQHHQGQRANRCTRSRASQSKHSKDGARFQQRDVMDHAGGACPLTLCAPSAGTSASERRPSRSQASHCAREGACFKVSTRCRVPLRQQSEAGAAQSSEGKGQGLPHAARIAGVAARSEPGFHMHTHQHKRVSAAPRSVRVHVRRWAAWNEKHIHGESEQREPPAPLAHVVHSRWPYARGTTGRPLVSAQHRLAPARERLRRARTHHALVGVVRVQLALYPTVHTRPHHAWCVG